MMSAASVFTAMFNTLACFALGFFLGVGLIAWLFRKEIFETGKCPYDEHDPEYPKPKSKHRHL